MDSVTTRKAPILHDFSRIMDEYDSRKLFKDSDLRHELPPNQMPYGTTPCEMGVKVETDPVTGEQGPRTQIHVGLGNFSPIAENHSTIKYNHGPGPYRTMFSFLREKTEFEEMGDENMDEYDDFCAPVFGNTGHLLFNSHADHTMKNDCRKIHAHHMHAMVETHATKETPRILVVGDHVGRSENFMIPDSVIYTSNPKVSSNFITLEDLKDQIGQFFGYYLMYEAEVSMEEMDIIRELFHGKTRVECYVDWHALKNDKSAFTGVEAPRIDDHGNYLFMASLGGSYFPSVNYKEIEHMSKMDCSQFHSLYSIKGKSSVRRLFHMWVHCIKQPKPTSFEFNGGLPLTDQDASMVYSKQYLVSEKTDGRLGRLIIEGENYKILDYDDKELRSGNWHFKDDHAVLQLELMVRERHVVTDVYYARGFFGGFKYRYKFATFRRRALLDIGISVKPWYPSYMAPQLFKVAKEGIVLQRNSPPGRPCVIGTERYGTARYIKKRLTIDKFLQTSESIKFRGPGVYELDYLQHNVGVIEIIRPRLDKKHSNTPIQETMLYNAWEIDKLSLNYPKLNKPCLVGSKARSVTLTNYAPPLNQPMTVPEWKKKYRRFGLCKVVREDGETEMVNPVLM